MLLRSNFSSFPQYFQYISNFNSPITYIFVKCGCSNYFFLNSANLICRSTDISKYFRKSLGIRDNESTVFQIIWIAVSTSRIFLLELQRPLVFSTGIFLWQLHIPRNLHTKSLCVPSWSPQPQFGSMHSSFNRSN